MSIATQLREEGIQQGLERGVIIGESTLLLSLLESKFGTIPSSLCERIQSADSAQLLKWAKRILEIKHIFQLFEEENEEIFA